MERQRKLPGKREQAAKAREMIMHGVGNVLGYWQEADPNPFAPATSASRLSDEEVEQFGQILLREADRVARLLGYEQAWTN